MSKHSATAVALFALPLAIAACGSQPAKDPSSENGENAKKEDDTPKWDTSSESAETAAASKRRPSSASSSDSSEPEKQSGSGPVTLGRSPPQVQRRSDQYDKESTEIVLNRAARQVKANCGFAKDEDGNGKGPWGKTTLTITLGHNGHAKGATVPSPFDGKPTGKCAVQAFSNLTFPPWSGPDTPVDWPIEIDQPK